MEQAIQGDEGDSHNVVKRSDKNTFFNSNHICALTSSTFCYFLYPYSLLIIFKPLDLFIIKWAYSS